MHSLVYVLIPCETKNIAEEMARLLAGSERNPDIEYPKFERKCSCVGWLAQHESQRDFDASDAGITFKSLIAAARQNNDEKTKKHLLLDRFREIRARERAHLAHQLPEPNCDFCCGTGIDLDDHDPSGKWNYWTIGGRWANHFIDIGYVVLTSDPDLRGNISYVSAAVIQSSPAAIVTPEAQWYEGPCTFNNILFEKEYSAEELRERTEWKQTGTALLTKYSDALVVAVDTHL